MTAIADLQAAWTTEIAKISDALIKAHATYLLERYIAAVAKVAALEADNVSSYSMLGRSITKRSTVDAKALSASLENDLAACVYGRTRRIDANMGSTTTT